MLDYINKRQPTKSTSKKSPHKKGLTIISKKENQIVWCNSLIVGDKVVAPLEI
jgi:hypothetical protein